MQDVNFEIHMTVAIRIAVLSDRRRVCPVQYSTVVSDENAASVFRTKHTGSEVSPQRWHLSNRRHGVTYQKKVFSTTTTVVINISKGHNPVLIVQVSITTCTDCNSSSH